METYVTLVKGIGTQEGTQAAVAAIEAAGCKLVNSYTLMGQYDALLILEAPDSMSVGMAIWRARQAAGGGDLQTETVRAFTAGEVAEILSRGQ